MTGLLSAWLAEAGIITYREFRQKHRPPLPADFVATFVVFGALGLLADVPNAKAPAAAIGWGLVVATALNLVDPASPFSREAENAQAEQIAVQSDSARAASG